MENHADFEIWQDGMCVAGCSGEREFALAEAKHYLFIYGQDGPVELFENIKVKIDLLSLREN